MSALGQKQTFAMQNVMSALPLIATAKADFPQEVMSALPLKADVCGAVAGVRFGPIADMPIFIRSLRRLVIERMLVRARPIFWPSSDSIQTRT
jgi:hypothetical protein